MKYPKGFKGKYFSLAAITATVAAVTLQASNASIDQTRANYLEHPKEEDSLKDEILLEVDESPVVVISKKITSQKSNVTSANKSPTIPTNLTDSVTVLTSEELSLRGVNTLKEALDTVSGITTAQSGGFGQQTSIFMQGMSNKYTLILIDGVRFNDPSNSSGANISHLLLDNIERIEIIKGAQSGVWGADAAAGVINIITKEAKPGFNASSSMEMGEHGHKHATLNLSYRTPLSDASLSISRLLYDGPTAQAPRGEDIDQYEDDPYRNTTVQTKVGHWINPDNRVEAGYRDVNSFVHYDGWNDPNSFETAKYREKSGFANYQHFSGAHGFTLSASKSQFKREHFETTPYMYRGEIEEIELRDRFKYSDEGVLVFGASYRDDEAIYEDESKNIRNQAGFINNTYNLNRWIFSQALRYDAFSEFDNKITGKLGLSYKITPEISVYINAGTAYKAPSILEMTNPWGVSNFDLKPENIQSYNAGIHLYSLHINLFQNRIKDMIDWVDDPSDWTKGRYENISGNSKFKGIEVSLKQAIARDWLMGASYTYTDARDKDGKRSLRVPYYQANGFLTYVPIKDLKITAIGDYVGSRKDINDVETGRYFIANLKADYEINKRWSVYAKLNNIFDKKYQEVDGYATLGRSFYAGFRVDF